MKLIALTGAGVSKASGVPTFVEMGDLREKLSRDYFNTHPKDFYNILIQMKDTVDRADPNPAHMALAEHHVPVITMNIDGLHHRAGSRENEVIEIHGSIRRVFCPECGRWYDFDVVRESIYCPNCPHTILQPDVVLYGDSIPRLSDALALVDSADRLVVIGTSFYTSTASYITQAAEAKNIPVDIINERAEEVLPDYIKQYSGGEHNDKPV